jgi:hypothetical protein
MVQWWAPDHIMLLEVLVDILYGVEILWSCAKGLEGKDRCQEH